METQQDIMGKTPTTGGPTTSKPATQERRSTRRCKITQLMRIRPSDPEKEHFDDMRGTLSVSRSGVYFQTSEPGYEIGMRLFVTLPYSQAPMSLNREYLAEVVRRNPLSTGMFGIGLKILMEMGVQQPASLGFSNSIW
jgi:PilZ domain